MHYVSQPFKLKLTASEQQSFLYASPLGVGSIRSGFQHRQLQYLCKRPPINTTAYDLLFSTSGELSAAIAKLDSLETLAKGLLHKRELVPQQAAVFTSTTEPLANPTSFARSRQHRWS